MYRQNKSYENNISNEIRLDFWVYVVQNKIIQGVLLFETLASTVVENFVSHTSLFQHNFQQNIIFKES